MTSALGEDRNLAFRNLKFIGNNTEGAWNVK